MESNPYHPAAKRRGNIILAFIKILTEVGQIVQGGSWLIPAYILYLFVCKEKTNLKLSGFWGIC